MNLELLKFIDREVYIGESDDPYKVAGIYWASEHLILLDDGGTFSVHYKDAVLVPKDDENEW